MPDPHTMLRTAEALLATVLLIGVSRPLWHLALVPGRLRARRTGSVLLIVVLMVYALAVVALAATRPDLLRPFSVAALGLMLVARFRGRESYGVRRGLPPGRVEIHSLAPYRDHRFLLQQARAHGPIFKTGTMIAVPTLEPLICVADLALARELFRTHDDDLEVYPPFPSSRVIPGGFLRNMERQTHDRFAPLFRRAMAQLDFDQFEDEFRSAARCALDEMASEARSGVHPGRHLRQMVFTCLASFLFGARRGSQELESVERVWQQLDIKRLNRWSPRHGLQRRWDQAVEQLGALPIVRPSLRSQLADLLGDSHGGSSSQEQAMVLGNLLQMLESGTADVSDLLTWNLKHLGDNPAALESLRSAASANDSLRIARNLLSETLRLEQSEYLNRRMKRDIRFAGFLFPKGAHLRICVREAHRNPDVFDSPEDFRPDRFEGRSFSGNQFAPFGIERHRCLAPGLTLVVGARLLAELAGGFTLEVVRDGEREFDRFHWRPSRELRLRLVQLEGRSR